MRLDNAKIGKMIRKFRKSRKMSLENLAFDAGISARYLGSVELLGPKISLEVFISILNALNLSDEEYSEVFKYVLECFDPTEEDDYFETAHAI